MFTTKDDVMTKNESRGEMVTPSYTGNLRGDPLGGRTRLLTNNICYGTNYYLGIQANGSRFLDRRGAWRFDGEGEQGMIDWWVMITRVAVLLRIVIMCPSPSLPSTLIQQPCGVALAWAWLWQVVDTGACCAVLCYVPAVQGCNSFELERCGGGGQQDRLGCARNRHQDGPRHLPCPILHGQDTR